MASYPSCKDKRSATNSIYLDICVEFIPMSRHGNASQINSCSIFTAWVIISRTVFAGKGFINFRYSRIANSVCNASSREINSLLKVRPGIKPRFFNQKIEQNAPEKNIPSTQANATSRAAKESSFE